MASPVDGITIGPEVPVEKVLVEFPPHLFDYEYVADRIAKVVPKPDAVVKDEGDLLRLQIATHLIERRKLVEQVLDQVEVELGIDGLRALAAAAKERAAGRHEKVLDEWAQKGLIER